MTDENIYNYFALMFGVSPDEHSLENLPIDSPCGADCKRAIDAGVALLAEHDNAFGVDAQDSHWDNRNAIVRDVNAIIACYWLG